MTCFIFLMLNITNDNKSNTEEHYSALFPAGFLHRGQDPETGFILSILALCSLGTGVKCLETSFSKQSFFR